MVQKQANENATARHVVQPDQKTKELVTAVPVNQPKAQPSSHETALPPGLALTQLNAQPRHTESTKNEDDTSSCGSDVDYTCPHGGGDQDADARDDQNAESDAEDRSVGAEHIANFTTVKKAKHAGEYAQTKPLRPPQSHGEVYFIARKAPKIFQSYARGDSNSGP